MRTCKSKSQSPPSEAASQTPKKRSKKSRRDSAKHEIPDVVVRVNYRLVSISVAVISIAVIASFVAHTIQTNRSAQHFKTLADEAEDSGDLSKAIKNLTLYLGFQRETSARPGRAVADTLKRLAEMHELRGTDARDDQRAFVYFEEAVRIDPQDSSARRKLVDVAMRLGRYADARHHVDLLLKLPDESPEHRAALLRNLAHCHLATRHIRKSQQAYAERLAILRDDCDPYLELASTVVTYPGEICSRGEIAPEENRELSFLTSAFPVEVSARQSAATATAEAILQLMVESAKPEWQARCQKALFLVEMPALSKRRPVDHSAARGQVEQIFADSDRNQDGYLDLATEIDRTTIPAFTDSDGDGLISAADLTQRLTKTEIMSRLREAESSIEEALKLAESESDDEGRATARSISVDVYLALAEALQYGDQAAARDYVVRAREAAAEAVAMERRSAASLLAQAKLELRTVAFESDAAARQKRLDTSEDLLRQSYSLLTSTNEPTEDDARRLTEVIGVLADVLIYQLEQIATASEAAGSVRPRSALKAEVETQLLPELVSRGAAVQWEHFLRGRLLLVEGRWKDADEAFRRSAMGFGHRPEFTRRLALLRARCAGHLQDPESQLEHTLALVRAEPHWGPGRVANAESYAAAGQIDQAIDEYSPYARQPQLTPRFVRLLIMRETARPIERRNWSAAERALEILGRQQENAVQYAILNAELLYQKALAAQFGHQKEDREGVSESARSHLEHAESSLRAALETSGDEVELWEALTGLIARRFDLPAEQIVARSQSVLTNAVEAVGDQASLRRVAAATATLQPKPAALATLVELLRENPDFGIGERATLRDAVAKAYWLIDERELAVEQYLEYLDDLEAERRPPTDLEMLISGLQLMVPMVAGGETMDLNVESSWNRLLEGIRHVEGDHGPYGSYFQGVKLILSDPDSMNGERVAEARNLLRAAQRRRPSWATVPRMLGESYLLAGHEDPEVAASYFEQAVELGERDNTVLVRVIQNYLQQGRLLDAESLYTRLAAESPRRLTGELGRLGWIVSRTLDEDNLILSVLRNQAQDSNDANEKILMAIDSVIRGRPTEESERLLKEACSLEPENPDPWLALVSYYARFRRIDEAVDTVEELTDRLPADPPALRPVTIAQAYETLSNSSPDRRTEFLELASLQYQQALARDATNINLKSAVAAFYRRTDQADAALELLDDLLDSNSSLSEEGRIQTIVSKALAIASRGTYADAEEALLLLKAATPQTSATKAAVFRAEASILDRRNGPGDASRLLEALERVSRHSPLRPRERFLKAALHEGAGGGDWQVARKEYEDLLLEFPDDEAALKALVTGLLSRAADEADLIAAEEYLGRLRTLAADAFGTKVLELRLAAAKGESDQQAVALADSVRSAVNRSPTIELIDQVDEAEAAKVSSNLAEIASQQGDRDALKMLASVDEAIGDGRLKDAQEALSAVARLQWVAAELRIEQVLRAANLLEQLDHIDLAESLYRDYSEKSARSEAVLSLAQFLGRQGRHAEALALCEAHWAELSVVAASRTCVGLLRHGGFRDSTIASVADRLTAAVAAASHPPDRIALLMLLADLEDQRQEYDKVQDIYSQVLQLKSDHVVAMNNLAWLLARRGQAASAVELIEHAIAVAGPYPELLDTKGVVLTNAGQPKQAVDVLAQASKVQPSAEIHLHLAEARFAAGDVSGARRDYAAAESYGLNPADLHPLDRHLHDELIRSLVR